MRISLISGKSAFTGWKCSQKKEIMDESGRYKTIKIAREAIESYLNTGKAPSYAITDPQFTRHLGAFVTIRRDGKLRGCIGYVGTDTPLYKTIREKAVAAATIDPRFPPLTNDEFKSCEIEVSILYPLSPLNNINNIKIGVHGLLLRYGQYQGVFLPEVPVTMGWTIQDYLENLSLKVGLEPDAWKAADLYTFETEKITE